MTVSTTSLDVGRALHVAFAVAACLVLVEWLHLAHGNLAVWTTFMVMAQYTTTSFQKGVERVLGRGLGILAGLMLLTVFRNAPLLGFVLKLAGLTVFFYFYFAGRLAYTFLNAGLYLAAIVEIGRLDQDVAFSTAGELFLAVVLGVAVADLANWVRGIESDLHIDAGSLPLWPIRAEWVSHSLLLVATVVIAQFLTRGLELPTTAALVSVMVLVITPEMNALLRKGVLRLEGALLAGLWAGASLLLLGRLPHFPVLVVLLFCGIFLAAYIARGDPAYAYAGVQMGLVLPMVLIMDRLEYDSMETLMARLEGIVLALSCAVVMGSIWSSFEQLPFIRAGGVPGAPGRDGADSSRERSTDAR